MHVSVEKGGELMRNAPLEQAEAWMSQGKEVVIATVLKTSVACSFPVGHQLVLNEEGGTTNSLLPPAVQANIIVSAASVFSNGEPTILRLSLNDGAVHASAANEANHIEIFVERVG